MVSLWKRLAFYAADITCVNLSFLLALWLRFDGNIPEAPLNAYIQYWPLLTLGAIILFTNFTLYSNLWQYASVTDYFKIFSAVTTFGILNWVFFLVVPQSLPRSVYILVWILMLASVAGVRVARRYLGLVRIILKSKTTKKRNNILIIGAGQAGSMVIKELFEHRELGNPVAIIDEDPVKKKRRIHGVPVVGSMELLKTAVEMYNVDEILIAIPSANEEDIRRILNQCKETGCKLKRLPGMYTLIDGRIQMSQIRDVNISDLLGRPEVELDLKEIKSFLRDQVILVTGAGGSIGSELCRQIAKFNPKLLVMLDNYENNLYELQLNLIDKHPDLRLATLIGSVQDEKRIEAIFQEYLPHVVFHAAAHKHVPLMEDSPTEAIKNNIFGTINVAKAADKYSAKKFVLISTDKAVNPTNVMGASKRIAEISLQQINKNSKTEFAAVRFGNVLGSNGSVIPIFQKQIAKGGPITVTHPEVTRYFMTIPEAVQLVIQAGALAKGGEVFILDMGEPVKIVDLAKDLIALSGYKETDIPIKFKGLRPGEKMYEELLLDVETSDKTSHSKIFICRASKDEKRNKEELRFLQKTLKIQSDSRFSEVMSMSEVATTRDTSQTGSK